MFTSYTIFSYVKNALLFVQVKNNFDKILIYYEPIIGSTCAEKVACKVHSASLFGKMTSTPNCGLFYPSMVFRL